MTSAIALRHRHQMMTTTFLLMGAAALMGGAFAFLRPTPNATNDDENSAELVVAEGGPVWTIIEEGDEGRVRAMPPPFWRLTPPLANGLFGRDRLLPPAINQIDQIDHIDQIAPVDTELSPAGLAWLASEGRMISPLHLYVVYPQPVLMTHAWVNRVWGWMLGLGAMALTALGLLTLRRLRPISARPVCTRPAPFLFGLSILGPLIPQLVLWHSECQLMPSLLMIAASAGIGAAGALLIGRRQLLSRLRWTAELTNPTSVGLADEREPEVVAEVMPQKMLPALGATEPTVWHRADVSARSDDAVPLRIALEGAWVDEAAATVLGDTAMQTPAQDVVTVIGWATRVPATVEAAPALCRAAGEQVRVVGSSEPLVLLGGTRADVLKSLRFDIALLGGSLVLSAGAALLALS